MICSWLHVSTQAQNLLILALIVVQDLQALNYSFYMFAAAEALAAQVTDENYVKGLIYPPFTNIRKISAHIAAKVAAKAYELGEFSVCLKISLPFLKHVVLHGFPPLQD